VLIWYYIFREADVFLRDFTQIAMNLKRLADVEMELTTKHAALLWNPKNPGTSMS